MSHKLYSTCSVLELTHRGPQVGSWWALHHRGPWLEVARGWRDAPVDREAAGWHRGLDTLVELHPAHLLGELVGVRGHRGLHELLLLHHWWSRGGLELLWRWAGSPGTRESTRIVGRLVKLLIGIHFSLLKTQKTD